MTATQILLARASIATVCSACTLAAVSFKRFRAGTEAAFDRTVQIVYVVSRVGLFGLLFLLLRLEPRGDIRIYVEQARAIFEGKMLYRDIPSAYGPLFPYLNGALLKFSSQGLGIMFFAIVCEFFILRLWLKHGREFFSDSQIRIAALLYLTSAISVQFVTIDGQNNALAGLTITAAILLLSRYRHVLSGFCLGIGIVTVKFLPLIFAPVFFLASPKRWRWAAGLALCCVPVYGWLALKHCPLLVPLTSEGALRSSGNLPFLLEAAIDVALPGRIYDSVVIIVLLTIAGLVWWYTQDATQKARLQAVSFGLAAATLGVVLFSKKSWPPYLVLTLFPMLVSIGMRRLNLVILAVFSVAACVESSAWWLATGPVSGSGTRAQLSTRPAQVVAFYLVELVLVGGYIWLFALTIQGIRSSGQSWVSEA